jgi:hypothetical protein
MPLRPFVTYSATGQKLSLGFQTAHRALVRNLAKIASTPEGPRQWLPARL